MTASQDRLVEELQGPLRELGLDLEAVELSPAGRRRVLRVAVDQDGGVTLDDVAEATRAVDAALEASDVMGEQPYTLEVTSRGVDRPLTAERHWRRNHDRLVKVNRHDGTSLTGRVVEAGPDRAVLDVGGARHEVAYDDVARALVQVELNRRPADGPADDPADDQSDDQSDDQADDQTDDLAPEEDH